MEINRKLLKEQPTSEPTSACSRRDVDGGRRDFSAHHDRGRRNGVDGGRHDGVDGGRRGDLDGVRRDLCGWTPPIQEVVRVLT